MKKIKAVNEERISTRRRKVNPHINILNHKIDGEKKCCGKKDFFFFVKRNADGNMNPRINKNAEH